MKNLNDLKTELTNEATRSLEVDSILADYGPALLAEAVETGLVSVCDYDGEECELAHPEAWILLRLTAAERAVMMCAMESAPSGAFEDGDFTAAMERSGSTREEVEAACETMRDRGWLKLFALGTGETFWVIPDTESVHTELEATDWSV